MKWLFKLLIVYSSCLFACSEDILDQRHKKGTHGKSGDVSKEVDNTPSDGPLTGIDDGRIGTEISEDPTDIKEDPSRAINVAIIADSIGRGLFARYNYGDTLPAEDTKTLVGILTDGLNDKKTLFKRLNESDFVAPIFSAYGGQGHENYPDHRSIIARIETTGGLFDDSRIGGIVADTPDALKGLMMQLDGFGPEKINKTIFALGNNDFCEPVKGSLAEFEDKFTQIYLEQLKAVVQHFPAADLLIVSPLNLPELSEITKDGLLKLEGLNPLAGALFGNPITCRTVQQLLCPALVTAGARDQMRALQRAITKAVNALADDNELTVAIEFADLSAEKITTDMLAIDCFHPNIKGQNFLAEQMMDKTKILLKRKP